MMNGAVWIPLVFLFQLRACRGARPVANAALSGMFLGVAFLSGHHQIPIYTAVAWAGVWIYLLVKDRRWCGSGRRRSSPACRRDANPPRERIRPARPPVGRRTRAGRMEPARALRGPCHYDLKAFSLFGIVFPGVKMHNDPFIGVVALALALFAVAALWRHTRVRLLAALALARGALLTGPQ